MIEQSTAGAVADGAISADERATLLADLARAGQEGWAFISVTLFSVVAVKPAAR